jgi:ubiquinone/menaquinone biosynthesis C-methylase UbiE
MSPKFSNPYKQAAEFSSPDKTLLSLCCGNGLEFNKTNAQEITAVDIVPEYLAVVNEKFPHVKTVKSDVLKFIKKQKDDSFDLINILDGIEHLTKKNGLELIKEMKRVCREQIILFTPDGFSKNEPHDAWDIHAEHGDHYQKHLSGWTEEELTDLGFRYVEGWYFHSPHNVEYRAIMMRYVKESEL